MTDPTPIHGTGDLSMSGTLHITKLGHDAIRRIAGDAKTNLYTKAITDAWADEMTTLFGLDDDERCDHGSDPSECYVCAYNDQPDEDQGSGRMGR